MPAQVTGDPSVQLSMAPRAPLAVVSQDNIKVVNALDTGDVESLLAVSGSTATVKGRLHRLFYPKTGQALILNFSDNYKSSAAAKIPYSLFSDVPDMRPYIGKTLLVSGQVENFKGRPQVDVCSASDIKVVQ
jgi:DNA/RNA endonuclease YhcR with UshA esterase domain